MKTEIIFEDKDILVVYKPAGIATQTSKVGERDVVSELKNYLKGGFVGVIHRLDQPVEGLLVFAKNPKAAAALSGQVKAKSLENDESTLCKDYLAVVLGEPAKAQGRLENMMIKTPERMAQIVEADLDDKVATGNKAGLNDKAKKAILNYEKLETTEKNGYKLSLLRVHLETGRFHQIRAQLSHMGCPIIGDKKYGSAESIKCAEELKIRNVSLCADKLAFDKKVYEHKPTGSLFAEFNVCKD